MSVIFLRAIAETLYCQSVAVTRASSAQTCRQSHRSSALHPRANSSLASKPSPRACGIPLLFLYPGLTRISMKRHPYDVLPAHRPLVLRELHLPTPLEIAILAPHPDDFDAIGVTLRRLYDQGHSLHLAVLTTGANGVEEGWEGLHDDAARAAVREAEQRASCQFFGLPPDRLCFLRLWEQPEDSVATRHDLYDRARLRDYLHAVRPNLVFLPHGNDSNRTHRRTYENFCNIAESDGLSVLACLNLDAKTVDIRRDLYTYFDQEEAAWKAQLLRFHRSQQERNLKTRGTGFDERVLKVNRDAAIQAGSVSTYAEVFELQRFG